MSRTMNNIKEAVEEAKTSRVPWIGYVHQEDERVKVMPTGEVFLRDRDSGVWKLLEKKGGK